MLTSSTLHRTSQPACWFLRRGRMLSLALWLSAALSTWSLLPRTARADTTIAGDLDLIVPVSTDNIKTGGGFGIRIGQQLHLPMVTINPEIGFTYGTFPDKGPTVYRGILGARVGFGELLRFGVLAHIGYGHISVPVDAVTNIVYDPSHSGFTYDAGIFLDFTAVPLLDIGVHAAYNRIAEGDRYEGVGWLQLGAHAALVF